MTSLDNRDTKKKITKKKERDPELNSVLHGPGKKYKSKDVKVEWLFLPVSAVSVKAFCYFSIAFNKSWK